MEIVHPVPLADAEPWLATLSTALLGQPWGDDFPLRLTRWTSDWQALNTWGAYDRGRWVGTLATEPRVLTVPGAGGRVNRLRVDSLTAVSVAATHRRRGTLTRMITDSLHEANDAGLAASVLLAAEWRIYGRFGYAPATWSAEYTYLPRRAGATVAPADGGFVRQVSTDELVNHAEDIYERARRLQAGGVDRLEGWWNRRLGHGGFEPIPDYRGHWVVHETDDGPDGLLCWRPDRDLSLNGALGSINVLELAAATPTAYRNLWAYLSGVDGIDEVRLSDRPVDEPVRWLLEDGRALHETDRVDDLWVRLLDVPAALEARGFAAADRLVLEVVDPDGAGFAAGRYLLDVDETGTASCTATTQSADVTLHQRALASAYLGDVTLQARSVGGGVDEHVRGAVARLDAMLATPRPPFNGTGF